MLQKVMNEIGLGDACWTFWMIWYMLISTWMSAVRKESNKSDLNESRLGNAAWTFLIVWYMLISTFELAVGKVFEQKLLKN